MCEPDSWHGVCWEHPRPPRRDSFWAWHECADMYGDLFNFGYRLFPFAAFVPCVDLSRLDLLPSTGELDGGDGSLDEGLCDAAVWSVVDGPVTDQNEHSQVYVILAPEVGRHPGCPSPDLVGNWAGFGNDAYAAADEAGWSVDQQAFVEQCFADPGGGVYNGSGGADGADAIALNKPPGCVSAQSLVAGLKMKAQRKKLGDAQVAILRAIFRENDTPNHVQKTVISLLVGLSMLQVSTWFNNRRKPERN